MFHKTEAEIMQNWKGDLSKPVVSVMCITYNQEDYIRDAIDSFLIQETDFPFEIIIHDDASFDGTSVIIKEYAKRFPGLIRPILRDENQFSQYGITFLENIYSKCKGDFVAICDGDDYWTDNLKLKGQVEILRENKDYSMTLHNACVLNCETHEKYLFNKKGVPTILGVRDVILRNWFSPTASFLVKKEFLGLHGLPESKEMSADIVILLRAAMNGKIHYSEKVMSVYRYSAKGSLSAEFANNKRILYFKKLNFLNYTNVVTNYKYFIYTSFIRAKIYVRLLSFCRFRFFKNYLVGNGK